MEPVCTQCGAPVAAAHNEQPAAGAALGLCIRCVAGDYAAPASTPLGAAGLFTFSISTLASVCVHTGLLIAAVLITWGADSSEDNGDDGTEVAIASLVREQLDNRPDESLDADEIARSPTDDEPLDSVDLLLNGPSDLRGDAAIDNVLAALAPSGAGASGAGASGAGASGAGAGGIPRIEPVSGGGGALDGRATFMGIQAQGRRFCIIADRSGSMFGTKFEHLKSEILKTLDGMRSYTRVQIILFNTRAMPYPKTEWLPPRTERDAIEVWLDGLVAAGDTNPTPAFVEAFELEPLPDAIFFMTDGQFDPRVVNQILRLNTVAQRTVPVHTITFVERAAEPMMRKIAADSGGKYRHVSGRFKAAAGRP